jgi:MFS family permease
MVLSCRTFKPSLVCLAGSQARRSVLTLLPAAWQADLNYPSASRIGLLNAMSYIAGIISGPVTSWALEKYGRKPALQHFSITMLIGTILGCVAGKVQGNGGFGLFCASKFIIGSGELHGVNFACSALTFPLARHGYRSHDGPNHATGNRSSSLSYYHCCSLCTSLSTLHEPTSVGAPIGVLLREPRSLPSTRRTKTGLLVTSSAPSFALVSVYDRLLLLGSVLTRTIRHPPGTSFMSGSWSWRLPYVFQAPPAAIMVVAVYFSKPSASLRRENVGSSQQLPR